MGNGHGPIAAERRRHRRGEPGDEGRLHAQGRHAQIGGASDLAGDVGIFVIEFDQGLHVLGDEGDRRQDHPLAVPGRAAERILRGRTDPGERADPALVADLPVGELRQLRGHRGGRRLHLRLIGIAALHHLFRQAVGGEEQAQVRRPAGAFPGLADQGRMGRDQGLVRGEAADRAAAARPPVGGGPVLERRRGRGRGELRIERQEDDLVGREGGHGLRRLVGPRLPVAHGDEGVGLTVRRGDPQGLLQRPGLLLRLRQQRRAAAHQGVVGLGHLPARGGDQGRQRIAGDGRQADDRRIAEEVEQEGLDGVRPVRPAQVEEDDGQLLHRRLRQPFPVTRPMARARFSTGVSGRTPWPRLKM